MNVSITAPAVTDPLYRTATDLAGRVASGEISAREVVDAHIRRIEEVDGRINAIVVRRFDEARREADDVDRARGQGQLLGPLAGVPMTVKECFYLRGTQATIGIGHYRNQLSETTSPLVERLRAAGAIVLGKTNIPQGMLMNETDGPVYGRANNPWNLERGPGGSSGGEAAAIAAGESVLGLGNDLGGSIRQPAHSCGLFGFKPTTNRLTNSGTFENLRGLEGVGVQAGPLARSAADIRLAYQILAAPGLSQIDWQIPPVSSDARPPRIDQMRIGYWVDDGFFTPSPAIRRAVLEAAQALRDVGASVEPFTPPDVPRAMSLFFALISADGGADLAQLLGRSPRDWRVNRLIRLGQIPAVLRPGLSTLMQLLGQRHLGMLMRNSGRLTGQRLWRITYARRDYVQAFVNQMTAGGFDCLLSPPHALPALTHGATTWLNTAGSHAMLVNLLGCPAGVAPVTRVRSDEESDRPASRDVAEKTAREVERGSAGLPVGVQIIGRHWREDDVLTVMQALEAELSSRDGYPCRPPL